ncbi:cytochrome P450 [Colletotrichum higginsianum]|uniref:Cytochrome P450 n=1 Tax=Colletotrichum higginsianum (strain IMI 349063) TaxID=759273 RepID=H1VSC6_COLHI|nr:Cytochrome P450 [Colletotrichum higginsianum IMI 349063]OBR14602.1 Cytochrome P450 [Colletotrichum higginsianum IMI 349063]CCF43134.1 cytochrome P450 [Colletotrichum higginsianum]
MSILECFKPVGKRKAKNGKRPLLPPGPPTRPLFGNLLQFKDSKGDPFHKQLLSLRDYGDMTTLHLGSKTLVFLNSNRVVSEIIAKRGSRTNERSPMPISNTLVDYGRKSLLLPQDQWAEPRRVMHSLLSGTALRQYGTWQELESTQMMAEYVIRPGAWYRHHYRYANSVIHRIALGERLVKTPEELVEMQNAVTFFVGSIGSSVIDWFPELDKLPRFLQFWRPHWEALGQWNLDLYSRWYNPIKNKVENGTAPPSFVRDVLLHPDTKFKGDDIDAMYVAMQLIEAGSDTTREALNIMTMAALEHPDVFQRAREEVDKVCGVDEEARLPTLADMDDLRYICAMAKEILRWRPIFPITPDHTASQDIEFEGYYFPAGTGFTVNGPAVSRDCDEPEEFKPERWLDGHETDIAHGLWAFGGGRRICVGYRLAQRSMFLNIARLVQCVDYRANGPYNSFVLNLEATDEPFPVKVMMRSAVYEALILREAEAAGVLEEARLFKD